MTAPSANWHALDRFFEHYYRRRPVNATFTGIHTYDADLPDWSPDGLAEAVAEMEGLRRALATAVDEATARTKQNGWDWPTIDRELADAFLEIQIEELQGGHFQRGNPALHTGEAVFAVVSLMLRDFAPAEQRVEPIVHRLEMIPHFLRAARDTLGSRPVPRSWLDRASAECDGAILALGDGLLRWRAQQGLHERYLSVLENAARPALAAFADFQNWFGSLAEAPAARSGCGPDFYDLLLLRGHWCRQSRQALLAEARERFDEETQRLQEMCLALGFDGWPAIQARLAALHPTADTYLSSFHRQWDECQRLAMERELVTWSSTPIRYVPIPAWARAAAEKLYFLHYRSPAPFDPPETTDYLVPPIDADLAADRVDHLLSVTNDSVIKLNHVVHHGSIGHHLQNHYAGQSESNIGRVAAVDCASRIGMFCGGTMAEGWACYATDLMEETGFLTELEQVAQEHSRVRQLARAIVDLQLHQHSISETEARQFYTEKVGMSPEGAAKEVTRDSMFPGTAVMYWLGTRAIHDLRAKRQALEGRRFSPRTFHNHLLSFGSIPVLLISQLMSPEQER